jgi:ABC-type Mn2+/Zn2+ transport system ATPase subunit
VFKRKKEIVSPEEVLSVREPARLELENVTVSYNGKPVLDNISLQVPHGARAAVVGPNGAGKSTLFKAMVGLLPLKRGRILIHGMPLGHHLDCVAYVPQKDEVDWRFPVTVEDVVMMGRFGRLARLRRPGQIDREVVARCLEQMGIAHIASEPVGDLSGGQQQRVFLARALAQEPHILLMDEPFTGVDTATQETTLNLLDELHLNHVTILISTHDLNLASERFDQVLLINRRLIAFGPPDKTFTPDNLSQAFSGKLLVLPGGAMLVDDCCPPQEGASEAKILTQEEMGDRK